MWRLYRRLNGLQADFSRLMRIHLIVVRGAMIPLRGFVSFDAPFSTEPTVDDEERPPGRDLTEYIENAMSSRGMVSRGVHQHDAYGWYFEVPIGAVVIWCMVQLSDNWLLISKPSVPLLKRIFWKGTR